MNLINFLKEKIKQGVDRNIMYLDSDAKPGTISPRLISLMKKGFREYCNGELAVCLFAGTGEKSKSKFSIVYLHELNEEEELTKFYLNDLGGSLPDNKFNICVMLGNTEILLGAY